MAFDLGRKENQLSVLAEEGVEFELTHPDTDEPLGAFVKVRGQRSKIVEKYTRNLINSELRASNAKKTSEKAKPIEESIEDLNEAVFVRIISWRGLEDDGKVVEFNKENALKLFQDFPEFRDQILKVSNEGERFLSNGS